MPEVGGSYEERVKRALTEADCVFWEVIANHFPEIKAGDESPMEFVERNTFLEKQINQWYSNNSYSIQEREK